MEHPGGPGVARVPPARLERVLEQILEPGPAEVIVGDLREVFLDDLQRLGATRARWRYGRQVVAVAISAAAGRFGRVGGDLTRGFAAATLLMFAVAGANLSPLPTLILTLGGLTLFLHSAGVSAFAIRRRRAVGLLLGFFGATLALDLVRALLRGASLPHPWGFSRAVILVFVLSAVLAPMAAALSSRRGVWLLPMALMPSLVWVFDLWGLVRGPALQRIHAIGFPMTFGFGPEGWGRWNLAVDVTFWLLCATALALLVERRREHTPASPVAPNP